MAHSANMTRRSFVKATALAAAATAIGASMSDSLEEADPAYAESAVETKKVKTCCHGCIQLCPCIAYVEDGVVTKLEGNPDAPESRGSLCIKGLNQLHTMYSPRRILHPLKRAGERGENKWEVISWDDALDLATEKITSTIDEYGPYSFFASVGGGGSYSFMEAMTLPMAFGSPTVFEPGCAQCYLPRWSLSKLFYGGNDQSVADNSVQEIFRTTNNQTELVVLWGAQPSTSQTAQSGRAMAELRANGVKTIVVDPNFSPDAVKATIWLPVRPGTDAGVLLSWFRYIFENELYNEEFTKYWTNLPFLIDPDTKLPVKANELFPDYESPTPDNTPAYVCYDLKTESVQPFPYSLPEDSPVDPAVFTTQTIDGKEYKSAGQIYKEEAEPWTFEHCEEVCWVPADRNEEAVKLYVECEHSGIVNGVASDQEPSGASQVPLGCMGLDSIMGRVYTPGATMEKYGEGNTPTTRPVTYHNGFDGMFSDMYGVGAVVGMSDEENEARYANAEDWPQQEKMSQIMLDRLGMKDHKGLYAWCHSHIPTVREAIATGEPYKPRIWFDMSGNKLAMLGNAKSWYEVFPEVDFIIGQYPMLTSFHIEAADLVFPLREWLEEPLCDARYQLSTTWLQNEVVHIGETVSHSIPAAQVIQRCNEYWGDDAPGLVPGYIGSATEEEVKQTCVDTFGAKDWDDLQENYDDYVPIVVDEDEYFGYNQHEVIVDDGLPAGFGTESRKVEVYCQILLRLARTGYPFCYPFEQEACDDYSPICCFNEPAESPYSDEDDEYPLVLTSGRVPYFHHGTMRHAPFSRELYPAPDVRINTRTAQELGIEHMDWVKVTSRRGSIHGRAYLTEGVDPGVVWMERYWNPECYDESMPEEKRSAGWRECNVNVLTKNTAPFNEVYGSYTNRGFTVKVEKDEKPDNIWIEPEEFEPFMPTLQSEPITEDVTFE